MPEGEGKRSPRPEKKGTGETNGDYALLVIKSEPFVLEPSVIGVMSIVDLAFVVNYRK